MIASGQDHLLAAGDLAMIGHHHDVARPVLAALAPPGEESAEGGVRAALRLCRRLDHDAESVRDLGLSRAWLEFELA